jgi:hypothetical protein
VSRPEPPRLDVSSPQSHNRSNNDRPLETADSSSDDDIIEKDLERAEEAEGERPEDAQGDSNLIVWNGPNDPENPMNWPLLKKWIITVTFGLITFCVTFASSVFSTATKATSIEFEVAPEVTILGTSLFVLGYAFGPLVGRISKQAICATAANLVGMGPRLRDLWSKIANVLWLYSFCYLPDPSRRRSKSRDHYALSFLRRRLCMRSFSYRGRCFGRLLGSSRKRYCCRYIRRSNFRGPSSRSHHGVSLEFHAPK